MFMLHKAKVRYIYFHSFKYMFLLANTSPIIFMKDNLQTTDMYIAVLSLKSVICYVSAITSPVGKIRWINVRLTVNPDVDMT